MGTVWLWFVEKTISASSWGQRFHKDADQFLRHADRNQFCSIVMVGLRSTKTDDLIGQTGQTVVTSAVQASRGGSLRRLVFYYAAHFLQSAEANPSL